MPATTLPSRPATARPCPPRRRPGRALLGALVLATAAAGGAHGATAAAPAGTAPAASSATPAAATTATTTTTTTTTTTLTAATPGTATLQVLPPFEIPALHRTRTVRVWLPPSYAASPERRYPVLYMHDGQNLFPGPDVPWGGWGVDTAMAELARTRGFEAIVVAVDHGGEHRITEMSPWPNQKQLPVEGPAYLAFVMETLKPWIDQHYRTRPDRASTAMIGSSLGALVTQDALLRYPKLVGRAAMFSPAYWFTPAVYDQTRAHPWPAGTRTYFYAGGKEGTDMVPDLDRMMDLLATQPHPPEDVALHVEPSASHDERAWRAEFPRAVAWLFQLAPLAHGAASSTAAPAATAPAPAATSTPR